MDYTTLKLIHLGCVWLSGTLFLTRGVAMLMHAPWYRRGLWRVLPHLIDSLLLLSALLMLWHLRLMPSEAPWLMAKLLLLVVYIALGSLALRPGRTQPVRAGAFVAALLVFATIVSVALSKHPAGWLAGIG